MACATATTVPQRYCPSVQTVLGHHFKTSADPRYFLFQVLTHLWSHFCLTINSCPVPLWPQYLRIIISVFNQCLRHHFKTSSIFVLSIDHLWLHFLSNINSCHATVATVSQKHHLGVQTVPRQHSEALERSEEFILGQSSHTSPQNATN